MNNYYTLIWKDLNNGDVVQFKSFITLENLRVYAKEYIRNGKLKNLKPVDKEKRFTIWIRKLR